MTRWKRRARFVRWSVLVVGLLCWAAGVWWAVLPLLGDNGPMGMLGTPLLVMFGWLPDEEWQYAADVVLLVGLLLVLQWMFLRPARGWAVKLSTTGRPMKTSVIAAACMAMLLSVGFAATLLELPDWWAWLYDTPGEKSVFLWVLWGAMLIVWGVWMWVFFVYWRQGDRYTQMGRMIRGLLAGTLLEVLIAAPVQAMTYRREDCYCARGSYTGLVFGGTVLLWCFGPGVVLLFMRERYRAAATLCDACGYDLRGTVLAGKSACPECGEAIKSRGTPA